MSIKYRADIDGLRAIAVVSVLFFHAGFTDFSGGYVGVDVFFVISGFLITSIIQSEISSGQFSLADFYERRIRRLLPALIPVLVFTAAFTFRYFPNDLFVDFANSLMAFFGFSSNWLFLSQTGYFDTEAFEKPLLHTWSLSIEEQYYLLFPSFMLVFFARFRAVTEILVGLVLVGSLALCIYWVQRGETDLAFYNSLSRVWELMIGSLLALRGPDLAKQAIWALAARVIGLAMIITPVLIYSEDTRFPGLTATVPVIGTALLIAAGSGKDIVTFAISSAPVVYVGKISYALYLWHWPIFAFIHLRWPHPTDDKVVIGILVAIALSALSYHFLEKPFRRRRFAKDQKSIYAMFALAFTIFIGFGATAHFTGGMTYRAVVLDGEFKAELLQAFETGQKERQIAVRTGECHFRRETDRDLLLSRFETCLAVSPNMKNILVLGDSHGADLYSALSQNYPEVNFLQATGAGCGLDTIGLLSTPQGDWQNLGPGNQRCMSRLALAFEVIAQGQLDGIVMTSRGSSTSYLPLTAVALAATLTERAPGVAIAVFGPTREFSPSARGYLTSAFDLPVDMGTINEVLNEHLSREGRAVAPEYRSSLRNQQIAFINKNQFICPDGTCTFFTTDGAAVFPDYGHWTERGAALIGDRIRQRFPNIMSLFDVAN